MKSTTHIYGLEDKPPLFIGLFLGLQHVTIIAISFVFPVLLVRETGGSTEQATFLISMSMIAGGVGTVAMALKKGPLGSGYLCPQVSGPSFITASVMCLHAGGLPLVFGMTMFAGAVEALFSRVVHRLRFLFPAEITGLIVAMVGITVIKLAGKNFFAMDPATGSLDTNGLAVALITLAAMVGLNVWTKGKVRLFCILIGMVVGYVAAFALGRCTGADLALAMDRPLVWFPFTRHPGWAFDIALALPVGIAVLCSSIKSIGDLTTCQKINDPDWKRPDMNNIQKGILADSLGCFSAGLLGGFGQSTSSTNVGLTIATGATSRYIAFFTGLVLLVLAFCPKLAGIFAIMPAPVIGATLIFALGFMVVAGFQIVMSRIIDARKTFVIGLPLIFGLTMDLIPGLHESAPHFLQPVLASSLSTATVLAVLLNLVLRIGVRSTATLRLSTGMNFSQAVFGFMQDQGGAWAARPEVVERAAGVMNEYMEAVTETLAPDDQVDMAVSFDEYNLNIDIRHTGEPPRFPDRPPTPEEMFEEGGTGLMAGYLVQFWTDRVTAKSKDDKAQVRLHFDH